MIKRRVHIVNTYITNVYYKATENTRRRSYLWLLLPILLLAGNQKINNKKFNYLNFTSISGYYSYDPASIFLSFAYKISELEFSNFFPAFPELSLNFDFLPVFEFSGFNFLPAFDFSFFNFLPIINFSSFYFLNDYLLRFFAIISEHVFFVYSYVFEKLFLVFTLLGDELITVYHLFANITENFESVKLKIFGAELPIGPLDI